LPPSSHNICAYPPSSLTNLCLFDHFLSLTGGVSPPRRKKSSKTPPPLKPLFLFLPLIFCQRGGTEHIVANSFPTWHVCLTVPLLLPVPFPFGSPSFPQTARPRFGYVVIITPHLRGVFCSNGFQRVGTPSSYPFQNFLS